MRPNAVVARRLSMLQKGRSFIEWSDAYSLAADIAATLAIILSQLRPIDPGIALERLRRFLDGAGAC